MTTTTLIAALLAAVGVVGILVPVLPGLLLVWAGIALWAVTTGGVAGWGLLALATVLVALGALAKYLLPGRRLRESGVGWTTIAAGGVLGVVGFLVVPVLGLPLGFVLGVYLAELSRHRDHAVARPSTLAALRAVGWSILIELATALLAIAAWVGVALAT